MIYFATPDQKKKPHKGLGKKVNFRFKQQKYSRRHFLTLLLVVYSMEKRNTPIPSRNIDLLTWSSKN
jgi:hypothetical protein